MIRQAPTSPASAAEPVTARISSGKATQVSVVPSSEAAAPIQSIWNRELRRSGGSSPCPPLRPLRTLMLGASQPAVGVQ
ncbi:hypothetical protein GCM10027612_08420 [Microbispora bryophytorum subsp. camponoti]